MCFLNVHSRGKEFWKQASHSTEAGQRGQS